MLNVLVYVSDAKIGVRYGMFIDCLYYYLFVTISIINSTMEIRQLKYFVAVAETLNFSEAGRRLYVTQGTLSQQIQQLEFELGSQLFERSSHGVSLTEAGEELLPLARDVIASSEECLYRMHDLRGALSGTLRIGSINTFKGMLTNAIKPFMKENPGVSIVVQFSTAEGLLDMLRTKQIDVALAYKSVIENDDVESEVLFKTSLHILMRDGHPLSGESGLTLGQLGRFGIIKPGQGLQARRSFDKFIGIDTRNIAVKVETNDSDFAMDLVLSSDLLAISSPLPALDRKGIVAVKLDDDRYQMACCAHRLKHGYMKKSVEIFLKHLRNSAMLERLFRDLPR